MRVAIDLGCRKARRKQAWARLAVAALAAVGGERALGDARQYIGAAGTTNWNSGLNWLFFNIPGPGDDANVTFNDIFNRTVNYDGASVPLNSATISNAGPGGTVLSVAGNTLLTQNLFVSGATSGVNQSGGNVTALQQMFLSQGASYQLSGSGTLTVASQENIGSSGSATFTQNGGTHNALSLLDIGIGGTGVYNLINGQLSANAEDIAVFGSNGTLNNAGGQNNSATIRAGSFGTGGVGTVNVSGGVVSTGDILLGGFNGAPVAVGIVNSTGGMLNVTNGITVFDSSIGTNVSSITIDGGTVSSGFISAPDWNKLIFKRGSLTLTGTSSNAGTLNIGGGGDATLTQNGGSVYASLSLGGAVGTATYKLTDGLLSVTGQENVGASGIGVITQSGGTHTASGLLDIGIAGGGNGTYTLSAGTLNAGAIDLAVFGATGKLTQSGGTINANDLRVGAFGAGGMGTVEASGGTMNIAGVILLGGIGNTPVAKGVMTVSGATVTVGNYVHIYGTNGSSLNVSAGSLTSPAAYFTESATGSLSGTGVLAVNGEEAIGPGGASFMQSGGSNQIFGGLTISGASSYTMSAGTLTSSYGEYVGYTNSAGVSTLTQSGGDNTMAVLLSVGSMAGASGTVNLSGGTMTVQTVEVGGNYGNVSGGTGQFNMTGGVLKATNIAVLNPASSFTLNGGTATAAALFMTPNWARLSFVKGTLNLTGGVSSNTGSLNIGISGAASGAAVVNQNGGAVYADQVVIATAAGGSGSYNLFSGTLNVQTDEMVGVAGAGTFNQTGGAHKIGGTLNMPGPGAGVFNLSGGSLTSGNIQFASHGTFHYSGGTLISAGGVHQSGGLFDASVPLTISPSTVAGYALTGGTLSAVRLDVAAGGPASVLSLDGGGVWRHTGPSASMNHDFTMAGAATIEVQTPDAVLTLGGAASGGGQITKTGPGTLQVTGSLAGAGGVAVSGGKVDFAATQKVAGLAINSGGAAMISNGVLTVGNNVNAAPLAFAASSAQLDLRTNGMIVDHPGGANNDASELTLVGNLIKSGYQNGTWVGNGIVSSTAVGRPNLAVGYGLGGDLLGAGGGSFFGQPADASSVLVRLTLKGDANLDGKVNFTDLVAVAQHYGQNGIWSGGDFDYDGAVGFSDLVAVAQHYGQNVSNALPGAPVDFNADVARAFASVPEPSALGVVMVGLAGLMRRRQRRASW